MGKKNKNQSLGRGLGAILGEVAEAYENEIGGVEEPDLKERIVEIPLDEIVPNPYQPRKSFDEAAIRELADSIRDHGLLQPVVVVENGDDYILIAGERRVRASREAGLETVRAIVADIDRSRFRELALIENIQREALNPVELARAYKELIEEHGITQEALARMVHKSRSQIANTMRLLQLDSYAQEKIARGEISQGHAKVMVGLKPEDQRILCDSIVGQKLSVRDTEKMAMGMKRESASEKSKSISNKKGEEEGIDLTPYKRIIEEHLPFRVRVKKSKLEISFENEERLKNFLKKFTKKGN